MSGQGRYESESFVATGDLSGAQNRIVELTGAREVGLPVGATGIGVLKNKPQAGEMATVAVNGSVRVQAGPAVSAGDYIKAASGGFATTIVSGDILSLVNVGRAVTAAASGMTFEMQMWAQKSFDAVSGSIVE